MTQLGTLSTAREDMTMAYAKDKHTEQICVLSAKGEIDKAHKLSLKPVVECGSCGAKANDLASVCDPVQLPEPGWFGD